MDDRAQGGAHCVTEATKVQMSGTGPKIAIVICLAVTGCAGTGGVVSRNSPQRSHERSESAQAVTLRDDAVVESAQKAFSGVNDELLAGADSVRSDEGRSSILPVRGEFHPEFREGESAFVAADDSRVTLASGVDPNRNSSSNSGDFPLPPEPIPEVIESAPERQVVRLDLATALALVGGQHPIVGFAQWRVQESYARLDQAEVLWLPTLQAGTSFSRHDGTLQDTAGRISDVNRSSFQAGLGAGAVGAGTTQNPGVIAQFQLSDAIFQPRIAQKTAWSRQHAATTAYHDQLLQVALAHLRLLTTRQDQRVIEEIHVKTVGLAKLTRDFAETGEGLQADADRMLTEAILVDSRLVEAREREQIAVARLAEAVSLDFCYQIELADPMLAPIDLISGDIDQTELITSGLRTRPELKEAQCLVAAACDQYQRQKYAPFVPSVLLGFSQTGFGGGLGTTSANFAPRVDYDAMALWQVRNLGFGERAARNEANARIEQSRFDQLRMMDRIAREISETRTQVIHRRQRVEITEGAIRSASASYDRNLARIRDRQGLPIEVLQSIQALEQAQRAFITAVADYNESQFRLQWALGWPIQ